MCQSSVVGQNQEELSERGGEKLYGKSDFGGAYTLKQLKDGEYDEEDDFADPRLAVTEVCTELEECQKERDHFKAAYARKIEEHAETLSQAQRVCEERGEWAGAHRVIRELDNEAESFEAQGNHAAARRLRERLEEVKKELK